MCLGCVGDHCTSPLHRLPPPNPRRQKKQGGPSSQDMPAQLRLPPRRPSQMRGATPERDVSPLCNIVPTDPIMYPSSLIAEFKRISEDNTRNRIETGGVLFGRMDEQRHSCRCYEAYHTEADCYSYIVGSQITDYSSLCSTSPDQILLGLIHTHPGFQSFMSSIDLHALHDISRLTNTAEISIVLAP